MPSVSRWSESDHRLGHASRLPSQFDSVASPFAFQVPPLARLNEARPVVRMTPPQPRFLLTLLTHRLHPALFSLALLLTSEHAQLHLPQSVTSAFSCLEPFVIPHHQVSRRCIVHLPQAHHLAFCTSQHYRSPQPINPFPVVNVSHSGLTG